jgi:ATP-dependent DNA helicase RecG
LSTNATLRTNNDSIRSSLQALRTPVRFITGIGPKRAEQLETFGLKTVEDLLYHLPFRYEDRRLIKKIGDATLKQYETFVGRLVRLDKKYIPRRRAQMLLGVLADETGTIDLVWYRAPAYLANSMVKGCQLLVHGRVEQGSGGPRQLIHPEFEVIEPNEERELQKIVPVYERPTGVPLSLLRKWIGLSLSQVGQRLPNQLPPAAMRRLGLLKLAEALRRIHQPNPDSNPVLLNHFSSPAHRSIIFDELFYLQLGLGLRKKSRARETGMVMGQSNHLRSRMAELLPFQLTGAQRRVLSEINGDMDSCGAMQRLIQGDVGSGKTMVAWFASLRAIENGYQAVWIAPTELLAEQHYRNLKTFGDALELKSALLTASQPAQEKKLALDRIKRGDLQFIVGTHALIQEGVHVPRMGLGVIDEQHRFGVTQRLSLQRLLSPQAASSPINRQPHILLMSATPIPRSLAMVLYGDMEVSFLDEMPPGRLPVQTKVFSQNERKTLYNLVVEQLRAGYQAFIVYPLVEASERLQEIRDATQMAEKMRQSVFKQFGVGLIHGRMSVAERDDVMRTFRDGSIGVLVSTTVIEVGIDIPNATVMVVEHAERFGLSQLHQLRGRVGRGKAPGYCMLVNRGARGIAEQRLRVMEQEHDGFKIAEADLALRGPGEFLGTRQSGLGDFRLVNLPRDAELLIEARKEAHAWLQKDPELRTAESSSIRKILLHRWGQRLELGAVG